MRCWKIISSHSAKAILFNIRCGTSFQNTGGGGNNFSLFRKFLPSQQYAVGAMQKHTLEQIFNKFVCTGCVRLTSQRVHQGWPHTCYCASRLYLYTHGNCEAILRPKHTAEGREQNIDLGYGKNKKVEMRRAEVFVSETKESRQAEPVDSTTIRSQLEVAIGISRHNSAMRGHEIFSFSLFNSRADLRQAAYARRGLARAERQSRQRKTG